MADVSQGSSSVVTGGVTVTAATLIPFVNWALGGFDRAHVPEGVPYLIAAAAITAAHAIYNLAAARLSKSQPTTTGATQ